MNYKFYFAINNFSYEPLRTQIKMMRGNKRFLGAMLIILQEFAAKKQKFRRYLSIDEI